jgi:hypothetical protein
MTLHWRSQKIKKQSRRRYSAESRLKFKRCNKHYNLVGRLVVVIDVNPSHGFWTAILMKVFGHERKFTCRYKTHGWIVYIMLFPLVCGISRGSSWLRRNEFLKMTK